jgi:hypothetical protein
VLEHQARDHGIERSIREWQGAGSGLGEVGAATSLVSNAHLIPRRVDADDQLCTEADGQTADLAVSAPDVEHTRGSREFSCGQRQDLLLVLRIRALGEPVDPPIGVRFPEIIVCHRASVR